MDTHIHQIYGNSMGTRMVSLCADLYMGMAECTIILTFLNLMFFVKSFIDHIFFIFLGFHFKVKSLMIFMNGISPTIKYTFTYFDKTVNLLDVKILLFWNQKIKIEL